MKKLFLYTNENLKNRRRDLRKKYTEAEKKVWRILRNKQMGFRFLRQYSVGSYVLDFYCPSRRLGVELDGGQHGEIFNEIYDRERTKYLNDLDIKIIRFWNNDALSNIDGVVEEISKNLTPLNLPLH